MTGPKMDVVEMERNLTKSLEIHYNDSLSTMSYEVQNEMRRPPRGCVSRVGTWKLEVEWPERDVTVTREMCCCLLPKPSPPRLLLLPVRADSFPRL